MSTRTSTYDGPALHDPATYAQGFPYEVFRELRDTDPVSHHDHPGWEDGYWAVSSPRRRATRLARLERLPERAEPVPPRPRRLRRRVGCVAPHDQPRSTRAHEAAQAHQLRVHAPSHQRPRGAGEGTRRLGDRLGRRSRRVRPRARRRPVAPAARDRRSRRGTRGGPQAGLRVDRAHLRVRCRHHPGGAGRGGAVDVRVRRRHVCRAGRRTTRRPDERAAPRRGRRRTPHADAAVGVLHAVAERGLGDDPQPHHHRHALAARAPRAARRACAPIPSSCRSRSRSCCATRPR